MNEAESFENVAESEVSRGKVKVNGVTLKTYKKEIDSCNIIEVEVGTTGYMGGDTGHGGRTYLSIKDVSSTDLSCNVKDNGKEYSFANTNRIDIMLGGDCELDTFISALEFAVEVLSGEYERKQQMQLTGKQKRQQKFCDYLNDVVKLFHNTGKLNNISKLQKKHNVSSISQQQFFMMNLHLTPKDEDFVLPKDFCDEVYKYILNPAKCERMPQYKNDAV